MTAFYIVIGIGLAYLTLSLCAAAPLIREEERKLEEKRNEK